MKMADTEATSRNVGGRTAGVNSSRWGSILVVLIPALLLAGCYGTIHVREEPPPAEALDRAAVDRGRSIYELKCQSCHGPEGRGDGPDADRFSSPLPDLSKPGLQLTATGLELIVDFPHYSPQAMRRRIRHGTEIMPEFRNEVTEQEIRDMVTFLQYLSQQRQPSE